MNIEISHVSQWTELKVQANNFGLHVGVTAQGFPLWRTEKKGRIRAKDLIGTYPTLFDLRAGISDWVAAQRRAGVRI